MNAYRKIRDFHGERAKGIGSSDLPILAGLTARYGSTPLRLWRQKTGREAPWAGNGRTAWGHKLEGIVLREHVEGAHGPEAAETFFKNYLAGRSIGPFKVNTECRHPEHRYAIAHADLVYDPGDGGEAYIQEAKTSGAHASRRGRDADYGYGSEDDGAEGIPAAVYLQVQWQLLVYGVRVAGVSLLRDTADFREYGPILPDLKVQEQALALAERFWWHVQRDKEPKPETWADVCAIYPDQQDTTKMIAGDEELRVLEMVRRAGEIADKIKNLEAERDDIKNALGILIGENSVLATADGRVLARSAPRSRESVALSNIEKKAPELAARLRAEGLVTSSSWRELRF